MRLYEMKRLPELAGSASLEFSQKYGMPLRKDSTIYLPKDDNVEFFPLLSGKQFILWVSGHNESGCFFGGTDEQPFLVRLKQEYLAYFARNGEKGFLESLKPRLIYRAEHIFKMSAIRQGDIFAVPLPYSWKELDKMQELCFDIGINPKSVKNVSLFGTRHTITGAICTGTLMGMNELSLGEGILSAPDHAPRELKGPHLLAQADGLYSPRNAD